MKVVEAPVPIQAHVRDHELWHCVCSCNDVIALCGLDVSDHPWGTKQAAESLCVVCNALEAHGPCPICGGVPR